MKLRNIKSIESRWLAYALIIVFFLTGYFDWRLTVVLSLLAADINLRFRD
jgi:hypothetical protein